MTRDFRHLVDRGLKGVQLVIRLQRPCRERRGFPAGGALPTLHGAFLPQRFQPRSVDQGSRGEPHAQGHSCPGEP